MFDPGLRNNAVATTVLFRMTDASGLYKTDKVIRYRSWFLGIEQYLDSGRGKKGVFLTCVNHVEISEFCLDSGPSSLLLL